MKLAEQTILLTGGGGAVGSALAEALAGDGARVAVLDRDEQALAQLEQRVPELGAYRCDLADPEQVESTVEAVHAALGPVTVLINNAGTIHSEPLVNLLSRDRKRHALESWQKTLDSNLNGLFYITACVAERMVTTRTRGLILNVSSVSAAGNVGQSAYAAAKAAVNALTVTWSKELGMFGVRSAAIAPGFLDTPSTHDALSEANVKKWTKQTPLQRLGTLQELTSAVRFVIENDYYNGRVLELDGGLRI